MEHRRDALIIGAIAAASVAIMARPLFYHEICTTAVMDAADYVNWTRQFAVSLTEGNFYPRWMPESHAGYGSPTFVFYPPLVVFLTALVYKAVDDIILTVNLVKLLGLFLSGLTMYVLMKDLCGWKAGMASALAYMVLPLRIFDLYVSGLYSMRFMFVVLPLALYFARKAAREASPGSYTAGLAVSFALLCLSHPLSAYMALPVVAAFGLVSAGRGERLRGLAVISLGAFLGLSMSAFYVLPALQERGLVHFDELQGYYWNRYRENYIFNPLGEYRATAHPLLYAGSLLTALAGSAVYMYYGPRAGRRFRPFAVFFIAVMLGALFMMSSYSDFLWAHVPGLAMVQFAKRWLYLLVMCSACLAGAGLLSAGNEDTGRPRAVKAAWGAVAILTMAGVAYYDARVAGGVYSMGRREVAEIPHDQDALEYVPGGVSLEWLKAAEAWSIFRKGAFADELARATDGKPRGLKFGVSKWDAEERSLIVETDEDAPLSIRTFNYPGWHARIDGREAPIRSEAVSGAILLDVPRGRHQLSLEFTDTSSRKAAKLWSALSGGAALFLFARRWRQAA